MLLAAQYPPVEFLIFAVAMLLALIGKIVDFARKMRQRSIEAEQRESRTFGEEAGEAPEPPRAEAPPLRFEILRRPPRPRLEEEAPRPPPPVRAQPRPPAPPAPRHEHGIIPLLRSPRGARSAIVLAEVLGPPKAFRRRR